jgi:branched-chain amino acid transport system substrate-binding protein
MPESSINVILGAELCYASLYHLLRKLEFRLNKGVSVKPVSSEMARMLRNSFGLSMLVGAALMLAACGSVGTTAHSGAADDFVVAAPISPVETQPLPGLAPPSGQVAAAPAPGGDQLGAGAVRVALIVPLTQSSGPSVVGVSFKNAAELALANGGSDVTLLVKDDHSTPEGARAAAEAAVAEGAELIIGPLFSPNVREVGRIARAANKPVIAFSTDVSAGGPGVYLLSFLVENYVDRIINFAAGKGKKSIAALIPDNDYGHVAEAEFQQIAARRGLRVMSIEHYQPQTLTPAVQKVAALGNQIDCLFIPEQTEAMPAMAQALTTAGLNSRKVQILGTALWNDARVLNLPPLQGAWFAAPDSAGFRDFADRYRAKFGSDPTRLATLAYDAVSLAAALAHRQGSQRFSDAALTNHAGFNGADGVFRFRPDGQNERGLSVFQINSGQAAVIGPAPRSLAASAASASAE